MPRRTIFVRDDDLEGFEGISNRPAWVHNSINNAGLLQSTDGDFDELVERPDHAVGTDTEPVDAEDLL